MQKTPKWSGNMSEELYKSMYNAVTVFEIE